MAAIPCDACGGKMNSDLAVCPHCGARRAATAAPKWSGDEIRALLATDATARRAEESRGMFQTLVMPHPATTGAARAAELALTVLALPLVFAGALSVAMLRRRSRTPIVTTATGEVTPALAMTVFGVVALLGSIPIAFVGGSVAALWARTLLRVRASGSRGRDLHRIERPARDAAPALPIAHALPSATPPPASDPLPLAANPPVPAAPAPPPPAPEPPLQPDAEPRLLR